MLWRLDWTREQLDRVLAEVLERVRLRMDKEMMLAGQCNEVTKIPRMFPRHEDCDCSSCLPWTF